MRRAVEDAKALAKGMALALKATAKDAVGRDSSAEERRIAELIDPDAAERLRKRG